MSTEVCVCVCVETTGCVCSLMSNHCLTRKDALTVVSQCIGFVFCVTKTIYISQKYDDTHLL